MAEDLGAVDVAGRSIAYRRAGDGPPLLLLHGGWSDSRAWRRQLEGLADEWTVLAWDAPGCGRSDDPPADFGLAGYADAVAGLAGALGLDRPHLLGLSFGGGLALEVYDRHPDLPRSLVLASAYAGWAGSLPSDVVAARLAAVLAEVERPPEEWVGSYLPGFFAGPVAQATLDEIVEMMCASRRTGIEPMIRAFAAADLRAVLPRITVPTLVLAGELDARAPVSIAQDLHARAPGSELVVLPGVGHVSNVEAPAAFDAAVRAFLRSVPA